MTIENDLTEKYEVVVEDLEYARVDDTPLLARLYRPRGVTRSEEQRLNSSHVVTSRMPSSA